MELPVRVIFLDMERQVNLWRDLISLWQLTLFIRRDNFALVHTMTPKAGLLGMLASWFCMVPIRIHTFQGEVWANKKGVLRWILRKLDTLVARLTSHILVVSHSERDFLIQEGVVEPAKSHVLANGSISGVDIHKFKPDPVVRQVERAARDFLPEHIVFLYLGRITSEKGVFEIAHAFNALALVRPQARLVIAGPNEGNTQEKLVALLQPYTNQVRFEPYTDNPENILRSADVLLLPSYREGFGVVIIEAAAVGVPTIGSRIYGISDAIEEGKTGLLVNSADAKSLELAMIQMIDDSALRNSLGLAALNRTVHKFQSDIVLEAFINYYANLFANYFPIDDFQ
jgi:glycosyltransferase involved in cell wall biosynthesis